jgi:hypothetical protein
MGPSQDAVAKLLRARAAGGTLREAAASVGVHVATVCRWQNADPEFYRRMLQAHREARRFDLIVNGGPRPHVPWRRDCPQCQARVVVRTAPGKLRFWRCGRWPWCRWASWRPRAPWDCRRCGGPRYWSHSRKSISCAACGVRIMTH